MSDPIEPDTAPAATPPDDARDADAPPVAPERETDDDVPARPREIGGQAGPEPTRYGDWEKKGRCTDF